MNRESKEPEGRGGPAPGQAAPLPRLRVVGESDSYDDWDAIYLDNVARVYRLMYAKVANRSDAEDLTAEVFLAALRPLRVSASRGEVQAYLLTTARSVLARFWRQRLGVKVTTIDPDADLGPPEPSDTPSPAPARVRRILDGLPQRSRRILELRFLEAMSLKEAAAEMNVTVANAKVLQHRAVRMAAQTPVKRS